jgi:hypothetical protein
MNEIILQTANLPDNVQDLSRFVLFERERYTAVRAEIRAIEKLKLAEKICNQKRKEAQMLAEILLDAEVRLGELFKQIPKNQGKRTDIEHSNSDVTMSEKPKEEILNNLGFSKMQANRLETLANNQKLVEYVKAEARENGEYPTRARVLELAGFEIKKKITMITKMILMAMRNLKILMKQHKLPILKIIIRHNKKKKSKNMKNL